MSISEFLSKIVRALGEAEVPFMLTGSLAAAYYGAARATQGIDLVISPGKPQLARFLTSLLDGGLYVSEEAATEAFESGGQFNAIDPTTGWKADLIVRRARQFSHAEFERRITTQMFGVEVAVATIEDLILAKLEWSELGDSELQRRDVALLLDARGETLEVEYLQKWIDQLGLASAWAKVRRQPG